MFFSYNANKNLIVNWTNNKISYVRACASVNIGFKNIKNFVYIEATPKDKVGEISVENGNIVFNTVSENWIVKCSHYLKSTSVGYILQQRCFLEIPFSSIVQSVAELENYSERQI